jgi:hypothetical protein
LLLGRSCCRGSDWRSLLLFCGDCCSLSSCRCFRSLRQRWAQSQLCASRGDNSLTLLPHDSANPLHLSNKRLMSTKEAPRQVQHASMHRSRLLPQQRDPSSAAQRSPTALHRPRSQRRRGRRHRGQPPGPKAPPTRAWSQPWSPQQPALQAWSQPWSPQQPALQAWSCLITGSSSCCCCFLLGGLHLLAQGSELLQSLTSGHGNQWTTTGSTNNDWKPPMHQEELE